MSIKKKTARKAYAYQMFLSLSIHAEKDLIDNL